MDCTWNRWYSKFLLEEVKTSKKGIAESILTNQRQQRLNTSLVVVRKNFAVPKMKDLTNEKNFRPITCLNTSYKLLTDLVGKYMKERTMENDIWDEGQLGAVVGVLGTVDQLIIDRSIMEEVKTYHRNLAVAFYDYKKAYDKVHHDWMLRVYKWIGIPDNVITLLNSLMRKWKTGLEI